MADPNEESEILLPEDDNHKTPLDSSPENHELAESKHVEGAVSSGIAEGICAG